jgi:hypothetical protein
LTGDATEEEEGSEYLTPNNPQTLISSNMISFGCLVEVVSVPNMALEILGTVAGVCWKTLTAV